MKSPVFRFKQFEIRQDLTAMKVGTDGVLLGAWAEVDNPRRILDIGTGTGLIALMLAQRFPTAQIDALEVETAAAEQALNNFEISPWKNRLHLIHSDFNEFQTENRYDLIVSNPPYFDEDYLSTDAGRNLARHSHSLRLKDLLLKSKKILSKQGSIQLILPVQKERNLQQILRNNQLYINKITYVKGRKDLSAKRVLLSISAYPVKTRTGSLTIEKARHEYTPEYIALTRDFYLKM